MAEPDVGGANDESRSERMARVRRAWRTRIIVGAVVASVALTLATMYLWGRQQARAVAPPPYVVVIGQSVLEDGTKTAGVISVIERSDSGFEVRAVDATLRRQIPGTSFDRLRDALAMGGPELVAELVADDIDDSDTPAWLFLEQAAWAGVVHDAGGVKASIEESTTAFTGDVLYRFSAGQATLSGDEAAALLLAADSFEDPETGRAVRELLGRELGQAAVERPDSVLKALADGVAQYSGPREQIENFLSE